MTNDGWTLPKIPIKKIEFTKELIPGKMMFEVYEDHVNVGIERNHSLTSFTLTKEQFEELKLWMVLG